MSKHRILEAPQQNPDDDLLGMRAYAETLARFVEGVSPPFTLGVYGEWGDGKTTFVNYLKHYLQKRDASIKFIDFSAWPHSGSDAVWRALIIRIAQYLYGVRSEEADPAADPAAPNAAGLWPLVADFLSRDALVLHRPPEPEDPQSEYKELIAKLDRTAYGSISKGSDQQLQINHEVALMTIVNGAIAALGTVSPLAAQIRSLLGVQPKIDLSQLLHTEKNTATRNIIESVKDFKRVFRKLFETKAGTGRVFIFVDDLDRCLPDVALDILEAVKIFFDESVQCIFIVAADQKVIAQGLRLRYRALQDGSDQNQLQAFFEQKGQEYFEKIIQFCVRVPKPTPVQGHTFICAQFPSWTAATDIIQTAVGDNPRRLKQYCNELSYKYTVRRMLDSAREQQPSTTGRGQ